VDDEAIAPDRHRSPSQAGDAVLRYITAAGAALIGASAPSLTVGPGLQDLARGYAVEVKVVALPELSSRWKKALAGRAWLWHAPVRGG
jgi:hypothetical protein